MQDMKLTDQVAGHEIAGHYLCDFVSDFYRPIFWVRSSFMGVWCTLAFSDLYLGLQRRHVACLYLEILD